MSGQKLPLWLINAVITKETGDVNVPAIINKATREIHAVIYLITGKQKKFEHLIKDEATKNI